MSGRIPSRDDTLSKLTCEKRKWGIYLRIPSCDALPVYTQSILYMRSYLLLYNICHFIHTRDDGVHAINCTAKRTTHLCFALLENECPAHTALYAGCDIYMLYKTHWARVKMRMSGFTLAPSPHSIAAPSWTDKGQGRITCNNLRGALAFIYRMVSVRQCVYTKCWVTSLYSRSYCVLGEASSVPYPAGGRSSQYTTDSGVNELCFG